MNFFACCNKVISECGWFFILWTHGTATRIWYHHGVIDCLRKLGNLAVETIVFYSHFRWWLLDVLDVAGVVWENWVWWWVPWCQWRYWVVQNSSCFGAVLDVMCVAQTRVGACAKLQTEQLAIVILLLWMLLVLICLFFLLATGSFYAAWHS